MVTVNTGAILHPGKKAGNHSMIGAGAVVLKNVKEGKSVFGNPAEYIEF
jgi:acetyltransferase-like isoleucine patch superfamily enzyme